MEITFFPGLGALKTGYFLLKFKIENLENKTILVPSLTYYRLMDNVKKKQVLKGPGPYRVYPIQPPRRFESRDVFHIF